VVKSSEPSALELKMVSDWSRSRAGDTSSGGAGVMEDMKGNIGAIGYFRRTVVFRRNAVFQEGSS
jgi:hypothetical protein